MTFGPARPEVGMIFPLRTDAPLYHYPIATVLLIAVCIVVHALRWFFAIPVETYALPLGNGLTPLQWITCNVIHLDITHLVGNLWFLWIFGIVVEGKVGFWRFILIVLSIGAGEACLEQLLYLNHPGTFSAGASVIIFGLMAIVLVWAPDNRFECIWIIYLAYHVEFEISHYTVAVIYFGINLLDIIFSGFTVSSSLLHMGGVLIGLPIAVIMLYVGWVNCEGYDLFTRYGHLLNLPEAYLPSNFGGADEDDDEMEDETKFTLGEELI
ncbi:MAG TPA: hypothetical protein DCM28_01275 [Phycisphaerales bacterium]|nr:hypothetical protein [Phycisphaerales bacterium]HCD35110.1 hypothetical protein [Phycisphaerales bacterium]|tara:strand:- start:96366 stop:97169 length:804 start_codon:yes stop_codon:yes gene_type:complete